MAIKKHNDFLDKTKIGIITAVHPQEKTVDIQYLSHGGNFNALNLPYAIVGLTWGFVFMPVKGDKVVIGNTDGDRPIIVSMHPNNIDYLPYLDPGEIAMLCENGSYVFGRNKRKRIKSTNTLIDYDATKGPNGETDIELEPGGLILRARSKQNRDGVIPHWDNHSYFSLFDNGDISLQSMYKGITKSLLFMEGQSGFTFWSAGDGKVQEYIEMNPALKEMVFFSDGDIHSHVQASDKQSVYKDIVKQIGGGLQINLGVDISTIPADFDKILPTNIGPGDIYIDNTTTLGAGKATLNLKGDFDINVNTGNVNISTTNGIVNITSHGNTTVNATGNVDIMGAKITLNGGSQTVATINDVNNAIISHVHPGVQNGTGVTSPGQGTISNSREVFA